MNRNLFVLGLLLAVVGFGLGVYVLSLLGILLMVPALLVSPRSPSPRPPPASEQQPWTSPRRPKPMPAAMPLQYPVRGPQPQPKTSMLPTPSQSQQSFSPALFPSMLLPPFSMPSASLPTPAGEETKVEPARDDLLEAGAIVVLLKLFLG